MNDADSTRTRDFDRLAAIAGITAALTAGQVDTGATAQVLLERSLALTGATGAALDLVDGDMMILAHTAGSLTDQHGRRRPLVDSLSGDAALRAALVVAPGAESTALGTPWADAGGNTLAAYPLHLTNGQRGALVLLWVATGAPVARDLQTLQLMAGLAGALLSRGGPAVQSAGSPRLALELVQNYTMHDEATGLPNHSLFLDRLSQAIHLARREDTPLAVLLFDLPLDPNPTGGAEDTELRAFAARLRATLRASDTTARVGVGLFAVLLPGANAVGALGTAKKLRRALAGGGGGADDAPELSARAGIAVYPDHGTDAVSLLQHAEAALARAKRHDVALAIYEA